MLRASPVLLTRRKAAYLPSCFERPAVHHEQPHVALGGGRQVFLGDAVAVAEHGVDHLVEIGPLVFADQEHVLSAGALQRLDDHLVVLLADESLDLVDVAADARLRADLFGKLLEVRFVDRAGQVFRVVEDHHAAVGDELAEENAGRLGPGALDRIGRRIVAEHDDVELVEIDVLGFVVGRLQLGEEFFERLVALAADTAGQGVDRTVGGADEIADAERVALVAHVHGGHREPGRGVRGQLGVDVVDDEGDFHWRRLVPVDAVIGLVSGRANVSSDS